MSRGQLPRRPEFFPRMKIRGARRRREYAQRGTVMLEKTTLSFRDVLAGFEQAAAAAAAALSNMAQLFAGSITRALAAEQRRVRVYLLNDRYQLDLIERRYRHDPIAWSNAVREHFEARINREFDDLEARAANARMGIPSDPWQTAMAALYTPDQIARIS